MDCNSTNISFSTGESVQTSYSFDVSTVEMRNEIIHSISEKIEYNVHKKELSQNRKWMFPFCNSSFYDSFIESA